LGKSDYLIVEKSSGKCPRCGQKTIVEDPNTGELHCSNCGFVIRERGVDSGPEWRAFDEEGKQRERAGAPVSVTYYDMGLSTTIGKENRDYAGSSLSITNKAVVDRLRKWDTRAQISAIERNLRQAIPELQGLADRLSAPQTIRERAAYIYRKALERGLTRGRSMTSMVAAALYAAYRESGVARTLKDIADAANVTKKEIAREYRMLVTELDLKMPIADATRSVIRIASTVGASERTTRRALQILTLAEKKGISAGKSPAGLAASALYIASVLEGEGKTQKEIANAAGITEVTIRNRYQGLVSALGIISGRRLRSKKTVVNNIDSILEAQSKSIQQTKQ
jgi:transcription initiation factor TFIIB